MLALSGRIIGGAIGVIAGRWLAEHFGFTLSWPVMAGVVIGIVVPASFREWRAVRRDRYRQP